MRTRVKICGITKTGDARMAVNAGADAIGMVFYAPSPRYIDTDTAKDIAKAVPAFITTVGLFVNADAEEVSKVLNQVPLTLLQFHGDESAEYCEQFGVPYIKALRVGQKEGGLNGDLLRKAVELHSNARGVLLDTYQQGIPGGTGEKFDWGLIPSIEQSIILAGGLNPENITEAIQSVKPYAVDVSGGVESAPAEKDAGRIRAFLKAVHLADYSC